MKSLTALNKFSYAIIFLLLCRTGYAQDIGVFANTPTKTYINDNDVTPSTTDFTDFDNTTSRTFYVDNTQNSGNTTLSVSSITLSNTTDFSLNLTGFDYTIGKNQDEPFSISYIGTSCGTFTSTVTIMSLNAGNDGPDNAWVYTISKTNGPEINIIDSGANNILTASANSPSVTNSTEFGTIGVGFSSPAVTYTIQNTNPNCPLTLSGAPIVALSNATDFTVNVASTTTPVAGSGSTTFTITFNPMSAGVKTSTITIPNNDSNESPYVFTVQGTGQIPQPEIDVLGNGVSITDGTTSTNPLDWTAFGNTGVGVPIVRTFTIDNTAGSGTLNITNPVTLSSTGTATGTYFAITSPPPATIAAGATATFQVTFTPTIRGEFLDFITIVNNDTDENPYEFSISGTSYIAASGDTWYYLDTGVDLDTALPTWKTNTGLYSTWSAGPSQLGFGDGDEVTTINNHGSITYYFRKQITATATESGHSTLVLRAMRDDGIIVYINGTKVWQNNMGATGNTYLTPASSNISGNPENAWLQYKISNLLLTGTNEVAVEIHQDAPSSSDVTFDFAMYTENGNLPPDVDGDYVVDYLDSDVDNDGVPDIAEGCYTANLEELHTTAGTSEQSINSTINGTTITMDDGNTITFGKTGSFVDVTSYLAGEHGWAIRVRGGPSNGTITFNYGTPVNDLFFKLADFDENERWTVNAYDDSNNLIDLSTSGNVFQLGSYINQTGNNFAEKFLGNGINNNGDAVEADPFGSIYFYFPNTLISRIEFVIDQPQGSTIRIAAMHFCSLDTDGDGIDDYHDSDSDNDGIPDMVEAGGHDTDGDGIADDITDTDGDGLPDIYDSTPAVYFAYELTVLPDYDFDGDGLPSRIDLDSDNDGILDIIEAGDVDIDGNGQIDGFLDTNNDGYHDAYDGAGSLLITGGDANSDGLPDAYPNKNQDGTGLPNFMDLDADDDGITDNTEAQATGAFIAYSTTETDNDGILDIFDNSGSWGGNGLTPVDTDGDGIPDYLDTDSDDGEEPDNIEGHDTNGDGVIDGSDTPSANTGIFTGIDADNDGLDDGYDNNPSGFDATNGTLQPTSHPIFDGGADRDWRHTQIALDFDGLNDHIDYGDEAAYEFNSDFTIEAWVLQEASVTTGTIVSKSNAKSGNEKGYKLVLNNSFPNLKWYDNSNVLQVNLVSPYAISNNRWFHIAATYNGTTAKLYIDGIEVASATPSIGPSYDTEKFIIGATYDSDTPSSPKDFFDGFIDEVRIWNVDLTQDQLHEMMNQEIEQNGTAVRGKVIPKNISGGLLWANLEGYYDMNDDDADDKSNNARNGSPKNITTLQEQTAPLPYTTKANGDWDDTTGTTPWTRGDTVWDEPNAIGIDGSTPIDWNIVEISHNVKIGTNTVLGRSRKVLGLKVLSNELLIDGDNATKTGNGLTVTNYLELNGDINLDGESQLIQTTGSDLVVGASGKLYRDQQGTADTFTYNYWSSPVGITDQETNEYSYKLPQVIKDGASNINFITSGYNGTNTTPIGLADYWVWKFANQLDDDYSSWQHVRSTGDIYAGEGFTMKGPGTGGISTDQNYVFSGKPNNGDINLTINAGNDYLVGNPYPSALHAHKFITDNSSSITGALYFWEHWGGGSHNLAEYQGGYHVLNLSGSTTAATQGSNDPDVGTGGVPLKSPGNFIAVSQGFFVVASATGGTINFNNGQRFFKKENGTSSTFVGMNDELNENDNAIITSNNQTRSQIDNPRLKLRIALFSVNTIRRQLLTTVDANASPGVDFGYDGKNYETQMDDMYWLIDNDKFVIQGINDINAETVLPLGIHTSDDGTNSIILDALENAPESLEVYLHDKVLNTYHNFKNGSYDIYLPAGEYLDRFEITFSNRDSLSINDEELNKVDVHYSNAIESIILINPTMQSIKSIEIANVLGQTVTVLKNISNESYKEIEVRNLSSGTYIVKLKTEKGTISKKVLVE